MELLSQRAFDIFRNIFPGLFIVGVFAVISISNIITPDQIFVNLIDKIQLNRIIFIIMMSYIIGIAHDQLCIITIRFLKLKNVNKREYTSNSTLSVSEKYALVRTFSPKIVSEIDKWQMLKGMCINIAGCLMYLLFCCFYKIIIGNPILPWLTIGTISFLSCILIYLRSKVYFTWAMVDLDIAVDVLNLEEKARSNFLQ